MYRFEANSPSLHVSGLAAPWGMSIRCAGEIGAGSVWVIEQLLATALKVDHSQADLDLREATLLDDSIVRVLGEADQALSAVGGALSIRVQEQQARLFQAARMDRVLDLQIDPEPSEDGAGALRCA
jgi:anti-anti-sigma regulatory factor